MLVIRTIIFLLLACSIRAQDLPLAFIKTMPTGGINPPTFVRSGTNWGQNLSSVTLSSFNCSGGNYLVVVVNQRSSLALRNISSVTANGVNMTKVFGTNYVDTKGSNAFYVLPSPTTGDIVVTLSGTANTSFQVDAGLFNNVGGFGAFNMDFSSAARTSASLSVNTLATDIVVDSFCGGNQWTASNGQTALWTQNAQAGACINGGYQSGTAGTTTFGYSGSSQASSLLGLVLNGQ